MAANSVATATKRKRKRTVLDIVLNIISVLLVLGALAFAASYTYACYQDVIGERGAAAEPKRVEVEMGWNTQRISNMLVEEGIIKNNFMFRLYTAVKYTNPNLQYGKFTVSNEMTYDEIIKQLQTPYIRKTVTVGFPEGTTALKMAMILAEKGFFVDKAEFEADHDAAYKKSIRNFLEACNYEYDVEFYDQIVEDDLKFCKLEGYLYPDTYQFYDDSDPEDVILKMLRTFQDKVMTEENTALINASGYSLEDIINLASIVQKETAGGEEQTKNIAQVFINRLNSSLYPNLQSCASTSRLSTGYINGVINYYYKTLAIESTPANMSEMLKVYDTYIHKGLIEGPICNPGSMCIEAVLSPIPNNYYFFCHNAAGRIYYATTYAQHQKNSAAAGLGAGGSF